MIEFRAAMVCGDCGKEVRLSSERFYAQFGIAFEARKAQLVNVLGRGRI
jgi:hypothetical protein